MAMCKKRDAVKSEIEKSITDIRWHVERPYTLVAIDVVLNGKKYTQAAMSKCSPRDAYDVERGKDVAFGRATITLAERIGLL